MSKVKGARLQAEIDRYRIEGQWRKVFELLPSVSTKGSSLEHMSDFYTGEVMLELFLENSKSVANPTPKYAVELHSVKKYLLAVFDSPAIMPEVAMECNLLLSKLCFIGAQYEDALTALSKAKFEQLDGKFNTLRTLRLVAEAYAIKGICLETDHPKLANRHQQIARQEKILECFLNSSKLATAYVKELDKVLQPGSLQVAPSAPVEVTFTQTLNLSSLSMASLKSQRVGAIIEIAIQRVPLLYLKRGKISAAIEQYRKLICAMDSPISCNLQQMLMLQLAELLLRAVSSSTYIPPDSQHSSISSSVAVVDTLSFSPPPPLLASLFNDPKLTKPSAFCPRNRLEEVFLLLTTSESIAHRDAIVSCGERYDELKRDTNRMLRQIENMLTLLLATLRQFTLLAQVFVAALRFAYQDSYLWSQWAFCLMCQHRNAYALKVLDTISRRTGASLTPSCLLNEARICIEHLALHDEGIKLAQKVFDNGTNCYEKNRACMLMGVAYGLKAQVLSIECDRSAVRDQATAMLREALNYDPKDYVTEFLLAVQLSINGQLEEAWNRCQSSLRKCRDQPMAKFLMGLLLTAQKRYDEALTVVDESLCDFPTHLALMVLKVKLKMKLGQTKDLLPTITELFLIQRMPKLFSKSPSFFQAHSTSVGQKGGASLTNTLATKSEPDLPLPPTLVGAVGRPLNLDMTDNESNVFSTLSYSVDQSCAMDSAHDSSFYPSLSVSARGGSWERLQFESNLWIELAEIFLELGKVSEVQHCINEACNIYPQFYQAMYLRGRVFHCLGQYSEAKSCYFAAIGISPYHIPSLRYLVMAYEAEGNRTMAEQLLKDMVRIDSSNYQTWLSFGKLLINQGKHAQAAKCYEKALVLEKETPLLPFSVIPRSVRFFVD